MWDMILATEQEAKQLAGSIIKVKVVRLEAINLSTRKIRVTVHGCLQISQKTGWEPFCEIWKRRGCLSDNK